jgi:hypothetical protein
VTKTEELLHHIAKAQGIARSMGSPWVLYHLDLANKYAKPLKPKGLPMTPKLKKAALAAIVTAVPVAIALWYIWFPAIYNQSLRWGVILENL